MRDYKFSEELASIFYIAIFSICIIIHFVVLLRNTSKGIKLLCKRTYVLTTWQVRRERLLKENDKTKRFFVIGMCSRLCCKKRNLKRDIKHDILRIERENRNKEEVAKKWNTDI